LGLKFNNADLLKEALTHRSYLNENPSWRLSNNERLEFLGDAVLELAVTEELFKRFPKKEEGGSHSLSRGISKHTPAFAKSPENLI
jgi:ribonuclease-3